MDKVKTFFLRLLVLLLPISFLFSSCDELEELFGMNTVTVTPNKLQFDNKASSDTVVVNCNGVWRVTARPDWVTVSSTDGMDGDELIISVSENLSDISRRAKVLLECGNASDSISIVQKSLNESLKFSYQEDYVGNLDAVLSPDGYVCLFGVDTREEVEGEYNKIFFITKADYETGEISSSDEICVVVDSIGMPNIISMENYNVYISNITNSTFDCIITEEGKENIDLKKLPLPKQESYSIKNATRSIASSNAIPLYGLDNLIDDIGKAQAMQAIITAATNREKLSAGIGAIGTVLGGEAGLTLGGISDALTGSLRNSYLALAGYMWSENQKFILNHIGPWHISIESVEQTGRNTCVVGYTIDGIWDDCEGKPRLYLNCQNSDKNKHTGKVEQALELGYAINGYHEVEIKNLKAGYYLIEMRLYDECHKVTNLSIRTYPPILLQMADLELSKYEIEENPQYEDGAVNFKMNIYLKGNEDGLKDIQQFGYYTKYANAIPDYKEVKNLSSIFESTPLTYELLIPRDGFSDETINYTTFQAKPSIDYYIGVYVVLKNGEITHFDEQTIENLIYEEKPEVTTLDAVTVSQNEATLKCEFDNCLFWGGERGIEYTDGSSNDYLLLGVTKEDGICEFQLTDLKPNTKYKYRAYYEINEKKMYGEQRTFTTEESESCTDGNHVHAVDLGLSVKWACCNVGAGSPEDYGDYFAWGETSPKSYYDWETYKYYNSSYKKLTKYCNNSNYGYNGYTDNKATLDLIDDAAHVNWGGAWRMPTYNDWDELLTNCAWTWTTLNGVKGYKVTSRSNGNSIFLPAAGYRDGTDVYDAGSRGDYWSSSLFSSYYACCKFFLSGSMGWVYTRCRGCAVRAVCP